MVTKISNLYSTYDCKFLLSAFYMTISPYLCDGVVSGVYMCVEGCYM